MLAEHKLHANVLKETEIEWKTIRVSGSQYYELHEINTQFSFEWNKISCTFILNGFLINTTESNPKHIFHFCLFHVIFLSGCVFFMCLAYAPASRNSNLQSQIIRGFEKKSGFFLGWKYIVSF